MKEKVSTLFIVDPGALLVKDFALVGVECLGTYLSAVGSGLVLTAVETISTVVDIKRKQNQRRRGSLSEMAFKKYIVRRITSASGIVSEPCSSLASNQMFIIVFRWSEQLQTLLLVLFSFPCPLSVR